MSDLNSCNLSQADSPSDWLSLDVGPRRRIHPVTVDPDEEVAEAESDLELPCDSVIKRNSEEEVHHA